MEGGQRRGNQSPGVGRVFLGREDRLPGTESRESNRGLKAHRGAAEPLGSRIRGARFTAHLWHTEAVQLREGDSASLSLGFLNHKGCWGDDTNTCLQA